jgi:hypothetical protein
MFIHPEWQIMLPFLRKEAWIACLSLLFCEMKQAYEGRERPYTLILEGSISVYG